MARQSMNPQPEPMRPVVITPQEEAVVDRIRMTPADRKAEDDARRRASGWRPSPERCVTRPSTGWTWPRRLACKRGPMPRPSPGWPTS